MLLTNCKYLVTQNKKREILEDVDVLIKGNEIVEIGKHLAKKYPKEKQMDCSHRIVMPGLINCHTHLGMTGLRGFKDDSELDSWRKAADLQRKDELKKENMENVLLGATECLRTGTTTVLDMHNTGRHNAEAAHSTGIRLIDCTAFFDDHKKHDIEEIKEQMPKEKYERSTAILSVHSIYGVSENFLRAVHEYATEHKLLIHIHVAETRKERVECKQKTGFLPIEYLNHLGFLGPDVIIAHAIWLTKGELDILARHKVKVVHCPQSNMKLAGGGVMPLKEMQERGILVALGTDSAASNNSLDMFREMHVAALLHKHHYWDATAADAQMVLDMATINAAQALNLNIGSIEEGKLADIITLDLDDVNLQPIDKDRILSHLVYSANGMNVAEVIVDGNVLVENKTPLLPKSQHK